MTNQEAKDIFDTRKTGYYWVKLPVYGWQIGLFTVVDNLWYFLVTNRQYRDDLLIEIDENAITRP